MIRAATILAMFLTFVTFASLGGAGGMEAAPGQMVHVGGAVVLLPSQLDRCQIAAPCSLSCVVCVAGMLTKSTDLLHSTASAVDLHRTRVGRMVSERLYRPPKVDRHLSDCNEQHQNKGTQDA